MEQNKDYNDALEECRIFFLEKCGEMNLAHYRALTRAFKIAYELGVKNGKKCEAVNDVENG